LQRICQTGEGDITQKISGRPDREASFDKTEFDESCLDEATTNQMEESLGSLQQMS
jgi:hypothetical protein